MNQKNTRAVVSLGAVIVFAGLVGCTSTATPAETSVSSESVFSSEPLSEDRLVGTWESESTPVIQLELKKGFEFDLNGTYCSVSGTWKLAGEHAILMAESGPQASRCLSSVMVDLWTGYEMRLSQDNKLLVYDTKGLIEVFSK